jgi:hypothetical protein
MFETQLTLYKFNLNYLRMLAADFAEEDLGRPPYPGGNPPIWILGHLAVATDYAGKMLGLRPACPREWHAQFAPGTSPAAIKTPYPTKADLVGAIENGHRRVAEALAAADAEALAQPHQVEILRQTILKTNAEVLSHLMCTHESFHIAQLSTCRRASGKPHVV